MAPWDKLSTKDRNMELQSKRIMLFESKRKCRIWVALEFLSLVDLKILKIGLEMAELAIPIEIGAGHRAAFTKPV